MYPVNNLMTVFCKCSEEDWKRLWPLRSASVWIWHHQLLPVIGFLFVWHWHLYRSESRLEVFSAARRRRRLNLTSSVGTWLSGFHLALLWHFWPVATVRELCSWQGRLEVTFLVRWCHCPNPASPVVGWLLFTISVALTYLIYLLPVSLLCVFQRQCNWTTFRVTVKMLCWIFTISFMSSANCFVNFHCSLCV
jgi:hypothetical protein